MQRIVGSAYQRITRVLDMLCLGFYSPTHAPAYSLHVQTQWRFVHNHKILLGSRDIYIPFSDTVSEDWHYSLTGRSKEESSIFDVISKEIDELMQGSIVLSVSISEFGDLQVVFSNNVIFEIFIPSSKKDEEWRLVDVVRGEHIIFYDV